VHRYKQANEAAGMQQYLVPYFMSSHPGCTLDDAIALAVYMKKTKQHPDQVQDFYPTPGTLSTAMFFTGLDPRDMKPVYVPRDPSEKAMQRALMHYFKPQNRPLVLSALKKAGREDLIGWGPECLIAPYVREKKTEDKNGKKPGKPGDHKPGKPGENRGGKGRNAKAEPARQERKPKHPVKGGGKPASRGEAPKRPGKGRR